MRHSDSMRTAAGHAAAVLASDVSAPAFRTCNPWDRETRRPDGEVACWDRADKSASGCSVHQQRRTEERDGPCVSRRIGTEASIPRDDPSGERGGCSGPTARMRGDRSSVPASHRSERRDRAAVAPDPPKVHGARAAVAADESTVPGERARVPANGVPVSADSASVRADRGAGAPNRAVVPGAGGRDVHTGSAMPARRVQWQGVRVKEPPGRAPRGSAQRASIAGQAGRPHAA